MDLSLPLRLPPSPLAAGSSSASLEEEEASFPSSLELYEASLDAVTETGAEAARVARRAATALIGCGVLELDDETVEISPVLRRLLWDSLDMSV